MFTEFSYGDTAEVTGVNNHPFSLWVYHIGANDRPVPQMLLTTYPCTVKYCFTVSADTATRIEQTMLSRFLVMPNDSDLSKAGSFRFYLLIRGFTGAVALSQPHSGEVFEALLEVIDDPMIRSELERRLYTGI